MPGYRNTDGRGRKPVSSLRYISANVAKRHIRFSFSEDIVARLLQTSGSGNLTVRSYQTLYLQIERFPYIAPHALLLRLALLGAGDPNTYHLRKLPRAPRYQVEIACRKLELQRGIPGGTFTDLFWDTSRRGLMLQFPVTSLTEEAQERWTRIERWRQMKEAVAG